MQGGVLRRLALQRAVAAELDSLLQARESRLHSRIVIGGVLVTVLVLGGLYFFYCFYLSMRSGMRTLTQRMKAMAAGDKEAAFAGWDPESVRMIEENEKRMGRNKAQRLTQWDMFAWLFGSMR